MTDEEMAEEYANGYATPDLEESFRAYMFDSSKEGFLAGLKAGRPKWHKVFIGEPWLVEYWDIPQDNLPKIENFYFIRLKNGFIKVCELKYDHWSKKKCFYNLHGGKQSNVAEWLDYPWLDYPTCDKE